MRSIVSLSLLSIGLFTTPFSLIQAKPVEAFTPQPLTFSAANFTITTAKTKTLQASLDNEVLSSSLTRVADYETEQFAIKQEEERQEKERLAKEEEAKKREEERQRVLAQEKQAAEAARLAEAERQYRAIAATPAPTPEPTPSPVTGSKEDWMRAAGIPEADWKYVDFIVFKESSWNPKAVNPTSGACGLAQALPCSKIPGDWSDPVNALKWQYNYVVARYGGYKGAYEFWIVNNWY